VSTALGRRGEERAARYLLRRGYDVLARNVRLGRGEIDIVARKGDVVAFVEVKAHKQREQSLLAVDARKCERLRSAASAWLGRQRDAASLQCRFDLIILTPGRGILPRTDIEHLKDIFR
jgi:putative endonuclease